MGNVRMYAAPAPQTTPKLVTIALAVALAVVALVAVVHQSAHPAETAATSALSADKCSRSWQVSQSFDPSHGGKGKKWCRKHCCNGRCFSRGFSNGGYGPEQTIFSCGQYPGIKAEMAADAAEMATPSAGPQTACATQRGRPITCECDHSWQCASNVCDGTCKPDANGRD